MSTRLSDATRQRRALIGTTIACSTTRLPVVDEQRTRLARRAGQVAVSGASGFTLVELLVTIVILGVLSGVVVLAVGGLQSKSQSSACAADRSALETASEAFRAVNGTYATESQLVAAGQLRSESSMHDVTVGSDGALTLTAIGPCADAELIAAAPEDEVTPIAEPTTTTSTVTSTTTTTTSPPATPTTTIKLRFATLSSICTESSRWPTERAWQIKNPNPAAVAFTLDATNATDHQGHHLEGFAAPGTTTWYLPAAGRGKNAAALDATGRRQSKNSTNRRC